MGRLKKRGKRGGKKAHGPRIYGTEQRGDNGGQTLPALIKGRKPAPLVPVPVKDGDGVPLSRSGMWWMLRRIKAGVASIEDGVLVREQALATLRSETATAREKGVAGEQLRRLAKDIDQVAARLAREEAAMDTPVGSTVGVGIAAAVSNDGDEHGGAAVVVKIQMKQG